MSSLAPVVVYGSDPNLLETRRLVLATLGAKVYAAADRRSVEQLMRDLQPGVLVLCYTLAVEERDRLVSFARTNYPAVKVLTLGADGPSAASTSDYFSIFTGPRALRMKVAELLVPGWAVDTAVPA